MNYYSKMTDYSKMSDFEINKRVALASGKNIKFISVDVDDNEIGVIVGQKYTRQQLPFDPCNNPADAWPIIVENKISIEHVIIKWRASSLVYDKKYESGFFIFRSESDVGDISSRGALRAAMIVFLMMQEKINGD